MWQTRTTALFWDTARPSYETASYTFHIKTFHWLKGHNTSIFQMAFNLKEICMKWSFELMVAWNYCTESLHLLTLYSITCTLPHKIWIWKCSHFCNLFISRFDGPRQPAACRTASRTPACSTRRCTSQRSWGPREVATTARLRTASDLLPSSPSGWTSTVSVLDARNWLEQFMDVFVIWKERLRD